MAGRAKKIDVKKELQKQQDDLSKSRMSKFFYHLSLQVALGNIEAFPIIHEAKSLSDLTKDVRSI